jgi:hypothetical protein
MDDTNDFDCTSLTGDGGNQVTIYDLMTRVASSGHSFATMFRLMNAGVY